MDVKQLSVSVEIRPFKLEDEDAVVDLWRRCDLVRRHNDPHKDIQRKLKVGPELFLVGVQDEQVIASVMAGYDGHRGWIYYLAVLPEFQHQGFAHAMLAAAERLLRKAGCPKVNVQLRPTNQIGLEFYRLTGYSDDDYANMGKRLIHDDIAV